MPYVIMREAGAVTTNGGNTVESQKWPLSDSSDRASAPQKPAKRSHPLLAKTALESAYVVIFDIELLYILQKRLCLQLEYYIL